MLPASLLFSLCLLFQTTYGLSPLSFGAHQELVQQTFDFTNDQTVPSSFSPSAYQTITPGIQGLKTKPTTVYRPRSVEALHQTRLRSLLRKESELEPLIWDQLEVNGPDVGDLHTLAQLARMSGNAYAMRGRSNWYDVDPAWNTSFPFGWEESDGFRGHVFISSDNSTIVLSIKGTTISGPTSRLDKFNDNLLFSCCCARVDFSWVFRTVCDCYSGHWTCDNQCLTDALVQDSLFYSVGVKLIEDLRVLYPTENIWLVGHSLGGSLASLLGATFGFPAVAFEAPGERLAASRLHLPLPPPINLPLPSPPSRQKLGFPYPTSVEPPIPVPTPPHLPPDHHPIATTHVYHTADPIPQGACTGFGSACAQAGYALETRCHLGQSIIFDTVEELGWAVDVRTHIIKAVVHRLLEGDHWWTDPDGIGDGDKIPTTSTVKPWGRKEKGGGKDEEDHKGKRRVPRPIIESDCVDCFKWEFGDFKDKDLTA